MAQSGRSPQHLNRHTRDVYYGIYHKEDYVDKAKLFMNGRSQAIRLPKEYRLAGSEVYVRKIEDLVILIPKKSPWKSLISSLSKFSDDFMSDRNQPKERATRADL